MIVNLIINGREVRMDLEAQTSLADALRSYGYVSVKKGCDQGVCGNCTVWVEGQPQLSCSLLAVRMEGKRITTVEGIESEASLLGQYLAAEGSDQCGYCAPGFVMQVAWIKHAFPQGVEEEQLSELLAGNLCRCSGYRGKMRAALAYVNGL